MMQLLICLALVVELSGCTKHAAEYVQVDAPFVYTANGQLVMGLAEEAFVIDAADGQPGCYRLTYGWDGGEFTGTAEWTGEVCGG